MLLGGLRLYFLARIDFDQAFRGGRILLFGQQPHGAAEHTGVILHRHGSAEAAPPRNRIAHLMRIVEVVAAHTHLRLQPARTAFLARK